MRWGLLLFVDLIEPAGNALHAIRGWASTESRNPTALPGCRPAWYEIIRHEVASKQRGAGAGATWCHTIRHGIE